MLKNLLLFSSSRVGDTDYLEHALSAIQSFLNNTERNTERLLFIPYAGISVGFDQYLAMVQKPFAEIGVKLDSIHQFDDKITAIENAGGIVIGGGNTFALLNSLYQDEIIPSIQKAIQQGTPYIGWSAGSNLAAPTICTTNDMPIIEPPSFKALNFLPWQINPHYIDGNPPGHNGETRQQRLEEYLTVNPQQKVIGIAEGTALKWQNNDLQYLGDSTGFVFASDNGQMNKNRFTNSQQLKQILSV